MDDNHPDDLVKTGSGGSVSLFLGLFLLILAFFIMLVSISSIEKTKSKKVMNSLTSEFAELIQPTTEPTEFVSQHGDFLSPEAFQAELTDVFTTAVSVTKVDVITPGRDMRFSLLARELFDDGSLKVRVARLPMIDRIVASLNRNPPGIRFQVVIGAAIPKIGDGDGGDASAKARDRVGAIARLLLARGAPADAISVSSFVGEAGRMRFDFHIRKAGELVVDFSSRKNLAEETAQAKSKAAATAATPAAQPSASPSVVPQVTPKTASPAAGKAR